MARKRARPSGAGLPGASSGNRTDLAIATPTGLPYGEAGALQQAQTTIPLAAAQPAPSPPAASAPPGAAGVPGGSNPPAGGLEALMAAAQQMPPPSGPGLGGPTQRPNEPVTAGLASGPGPGPEVLSAQQPATPLAQTLQAAAQATGSGLLANLAAQVTQQ